MKTKLLRLTTLAIALALFGSLCAIAIHAQQSNGRPSMPAPTTRWIGYLAFGTEETLDHITPGPGIFPKADPQVQIGLRSDGTVVWRRTSR